MARIQTSSAYSPRPTQRRRYLETPEMDSENDSEGVSRTNSQPDGNTSPQSTSVSIPRVQKLDMGAKCKDAREKLTRWNCYAFILPLMLIPFECITALTPTYAKIREDVQGPVPRIYRWKTKFHRQQAPPFDQILHAAGDSTEQKANHMIGFVPYHDDSDAIVDNWATILESGRSIFWEDLLYADLEGRRNFLNGGTERVQGRDRENPEDPRHEQHTSQEGATAAEQTRYLPSPPTVNESIPPQASSHADNSMVLHELQALKQTIEKMSTDHESRFLQLERLITENGNRVDMLTNIVSRFVQQQSETWKGGDRGESSGGGGKNSRGVDVRINVGGDIEAQDDIYAPTDVGFGTEISVERDMEDSPLNEIFYQTPTCSSDKDCEEDILDVGQQKRRPQRHLKKSNYKRTPYTDPGPKKMMFRKGSIKEFDPLRLPDSVQKSFEDYKNSVPKPPFTSGLGITRA
ncbi:hypothetical protein TIFTF001_012332 [Ficus carica]|uniref:Uncharacterized protein n=1 Tax=Ficus carica TaxID=3494 RepID=A0AA88AC43_FICCA|nr:hypothetical protein TIFTF001_012332 [Ficus carica]